MDTKTFKHSLHSSEHYHRKRFGHAAAVTGILDLSPNKGFEFFEPGKARVSDTNFL
jgi:hypothetical protein